MRAESGLISISYSVSCIYLSTQPSLSCASLANICKFFPSIDHTLWDSSILKINYRRGLFGNIYQCRRFGTVHFLLFCFICFEELLFLENYFSWLVKLKKVTFPHPLITSYKKEPNVKLWYVTCQSRNGKDNLTLMLFWINTIYVPAFKYWRAIKEMGISANCPLRRAFTVLTKL